MVTLRWILAWAHGDEDEVMEVRFLPDHAVAGHHNRGPAVKRASEKGTAKERNQSSRTS